MENLRARQHIASKCAIGQCPITKPIRTEIIVTTETIDTLTTDRGGRFTGNALTSLETVDIAAHIGHHAAELVAEHQGQFYGPALLFAPHMNIAAADTGGFNFD